MRAPAPGAPAISEACAADLPEIEALLGGVPLLRRYGISVAAATRDIREGLQRGDLVLLARIDGRPAGLARVVFTPALDRAAYLQLLAVRDDARARGAGGSLLARAEQASRARAANHLLLLATTDNARARAFYERRGYRYVGDLPGYARPELDEALYHKDLRPAPLALPEEDLPWIARR